MDDLSIKTRNIFLIVETIVFMNVIHIRVGVGHEFDRYQSRNVCRQICENSLNF